MISLTGAGPILLAILESILAAKFCNFQDRQAIASHFKRLDESIFSLVEQKIRDDYAQELIQDFLMKYQFNQNLTYSFISEEEKAEFVHTFFQRYPDLKYGEREQIESCLMQYIEGVNELYANILSVGEKAILQKIDAVAASIDKMETTMQDALCAAKSPSAATHEVKKAPLPFYNVGTPNKLFHGRTQTIDDVSKRLTTGHPVFLSGPGGIGKSQIAWEIAAQPQNNYELVMWFQANSETELLAEFNRAAIFYKLIQERRDDFDYVTSKLFAFAGDCSTCLIVYDGADDISLDFLTKKCVFPHSNTLITTQNSNIDPDSFSVVFVHPFTSKEARSFLMESSNFRVKTEQDAEDVSALCRLLDNFPLALEYARAYVNETQTSFADYIQVYGAHKQDILKEPIPKYGKSAYTAWKISYEKIIQQSPPAETVLNMLSFLDTHDIPLRDIFVESHQYRFYEWRHILSAMKRYSLITMQNGLANMHGLTQEFIRLQMREQLKYQVYYEKTLQVFRDLMPSRITNAEEKNLVNRIIKHSIQLISHNSNLDDPTAQRFASNIVSKLYVLGYYSQTIAFIEAQLETHSASQNFQLLQQITFLAQAYHYTGKDRPALDLLEKYGRAVLSSEALTDREKNALLSRYKNVEGIIQKDQKEIPSCLKSFREALSFHKNLAPEDQNADRDILCNLLINFGISYKHLSQYEEALRYYGLARLYADNSKHLLLRIFGNMAEAYHELGHAAPAFQYFKAALEYSVEVGDKRNECTCLTNLGNYYTDQLEYDKAAENLNASLKIAHEIEFFIGTAQAYRGLGDLAFALENRKDAQSYWTLSLKLSLSIGYKDGMESAKEALLRLSE